MKKSISFFSFLFLFGVSRIHAVSNQDTLILLNGTIVTGTIEDQSIEVLNNLQANINTWHTMIDQPDGKAVKVQNKDIDYFILGGKKYGNRHTVGGNHCVTIFVEGPNAGIYGRSGTVSNHFTHTDKTSNPMYEKTATTVDQEDMSYTEMFIKGKSIPYTYNIPYITAHFAKIFAQCPKLVEESKQGGFDFNDLIGIVKKYNACF